MLAALKNMAYINNVDLPTFSLTKAHTDPRFACGSQNSVCIHFGEVIQNHGRVNFRNTGQGESHHRIHERPRLGGGQAYDRSSIQTLDIICCTNPVLTDLVCTWTQCK